MALALPGLPFSLNFLSKLPNLHPFSPPKFPGCSVPRPPVSVFPLYAATGGWGPNAGHSGTPLPSLPPGRLSFTGVRWGWAAVLASQVVCGDPETPRMIPDGAGRVPAF